MKTSNVYIVTEYDSLCESYNIVGVYKNKEDAKVRVDRCILGREMYDIETLGEISDDYSYDIETYKLLGGDKCIK